MGFGGILGWVSAVICDKDKYCREYARREPRCTAQQVPKIMAALGESGKVTQLTNVGGRD